MIEILAGKGIENAFKELGINAKNTYKRVMPEEKGYHGEAYEVWELSDDDHERLCNVLDEDWKGEWGWWRSSEGSNMGFVDEAFTINNERIIAWCGTRRDNVEQEWLDEPEEEKDEYDDCSDYEETWYPHEYSDILEYFCVEIGASTEKNICALATDLARQNNMTMGELFTTFLS